MGKPDKKSSKSAEVISTAYSSDTAPAPLDRTPPFDFSTETFPKADDPNVFRQDILNLQIATPSSTLKRSHLTESK